MWQKAEYIRQAGNVAVHGTRRRRPRPPSTSCASFSTSPTGRAARTCAKGGGTPGQDIRRVADSQGGARGRAADIEALEAERDAAEEDKKEAESELEALRERLAEIKAENDAVPETHDWNEARTRELIIDLDLQRAGWPLDEPGTGSTK